MNRVPGLETVYNCNFSRHFKAALYGRSCRVAASAPVTLHVCAFRRHYCQTSSTLLDVTAAPLIRLAVIRAVHTPLGSKRAVKIPQTALATSFFFFQPYWISGIFVWNDSLSHARGIYSPWWSDTLKRQPQTSLVSLVLQNRVPGACFLWFMLLSDLFLQTHQLNKHRRLF